MTSSIAALDPAGAARALALARRLRGGELLADFIKRMSPHHPPPRHFGPLLEQLQGAATSPVNVCFSMPPRHGKTTIIQHAIPWWLSRFPGDTCAYASYSDRQAWSKSRVMRDIAGRAHVRLAADAANLAEWRTTSGGGVLAVGAGSGLTGQGVSGLMVVDDPFKNPEDAQSQVIRDKVGEWFDAVVQTRIEGASTLVIHTRWHEDDLIGRLAKDADFTVINLPALAEADDPLGRAEGEPLWPERFGLKYLEKRKRRNEYLFASLYQGRPRPRGSAVFGAPHYYDPKTLDLTGCRLVLAADPAASIKTSADYSAAGVIAVKGNGDAMIGYLLYAYREQVPIPQFAQDLLGMQARFGDTEINIEAVGGFKAIPQMLLAIRPDLRVHEIIPVGDKFMRAQPAASAWNTGRLLVPSDSPPWLGPLLDEVAKFTGVNDVYDDQVDWLAHAWNRAVGTGPSMWDVL